jgi:DNA-binding NarL/FixJ family response regulator
MKNDSTNLFEKLAAAKNYEQSLNLEMTSALERIKDLRIKLYCARLDRKSLSKRFDFIRNHADANEIELIVKLFPELETSRQIQIANEMTKLKTAKQIGEACFINEKTIKHHKSIIYATLKVHSEKQFLAEYQTRKALLEKKNDKR